MPPSPSRTTISYLLSSTCPMSGSRSGRVSGRAEISIRSVGALKEEKESPQLGQNRAVSLVTSWHLGQIIVALGFRQRRKGGCDRDVRCVLRVNERSA